VEAYRPEFLPQNPRECLDTVVCAVTPVLGRQRQGDPLKLVGQPAWTMWSVPGQVRVCLKKQGGWLTLEKRYLRACTHTHTHTYMHTYIHTHTHTHVHTYIHIHMCTHIYTHTHTYIHTHTHIHIHAYTHTYIHTHKYTYTRNPQ
jgi:hypothetical protein